MSMSLKLQVSKSAYVHKAFAQCSPQSRQAKNGPAVYDLPAAILALL